MTVDIMECSDQYQFAAGNSSSEAFFCAWERRSWQ